MIKDSLEVEVQLENVALKDPKVLLERLVKWDLLEVKVKLEHVVKKVTREILAVLVPLGPRGSTGTRCVLGASVTWSCWYRRSSWSPRTCLYNWPGSTLKVLLESVKGEKGIQGDNSDVLSVLADHQPIQLVTRNGEKMCFVKYHVSEDRSSIVESSGGVETLLYT